MSGDRNEDEDDVAWVSFSSAGYGSAEDDLWDDCLLYTSDAADE